MLSVNFEALISEAVVEAFVEGLVERELGAAMVDFLVSWSAREKMPVVDGL